MQRVRQPKMQKIETNLAKMKVLLIFLLYICSAREMTNDHTLLLTTVLTKWSFVVGMVHELCLFVFIIMSALIRQKFK